MREITKGQLKIIHTLLSKSGRMVFKRELVYAFSEQRTGSSRELYLEEAKQLIGYLKEVDPNQRMRRKIFSLFYELGWIENNHKDDIKINTGSINNFLLKRGAVKKTINRLSKDELQKVVTQLKSISKKTKAADEKKTGDIVKDLLNELNIDVLK